MDKSVFAKRKGTGTDYAGKNVLVIGTGLSGIGAAQLLCREGANVTLLDQNEKADENKIRDSFAGQLEWDELSHLTIDIGKLKNEASAFDLVVPSPAVPLDSPLLSSLIEAGVPVISEIELGWLFENGTVIAITGTNGKTTTTTLVGEIMKAAAQKGRFSRAYVVGNIGSSYAAAAVDTDEESVTVGEISSFQLEAARTFRPSVSAILNITPDHLNRHYTMQNYASKEGNTDVLLNVHDMQLVGVCNAENVMAAIAIADAAGVPTDLTVSVIKSFPPVPHRIEYVGCKGGVKYYNDSKATNPDAAIQGIRAMTGPTILIGGGYDKKNSYDEWIEAFDGKVKKLVLIGQTREDIAACARAHGFEDILFCDTFEECLKTCTALAKPGEEVLLSPACASWGMFPNYEVRGDVFREYVQNLPD